jgi:hypothetical protein
MILAVNGLLEKNTFVPDIPLMSIKKYWTKWLCHLGGVSISFIHFAGRAARRP